MKSKIFLVMKYKVIRRTSLYDSGKKYEEIGRFDCCDVVETEEEAICR